MSLLVKLSNFVFRCHVLGQKFFYTFSFKKCSIAFYLKGQCVEEFQAQYITMQNKIRQFNQ